MNEKLRDYRREAARRRVAAFLDRRDEMARGGGLHPDVIYSVGDREGDLLELRSEDLRLLLAP